jgi:hypothetical protein
MPSREFTTGGAEVAVVHIEHRQMEHLRRVLEHSVAHFKASDRPEDAERSEAVRQIVDASMRGAVD